MSFQNNHRSPTSQSESLAHLARSNSQPNSQSQSWEVIDPDATLSQPESQSTQPRQPPGAEVAPVASRPHLTTSQQPGVNNAKRTVSEKKHKETEEEIAARYSRVGIKRAPKLDNRRRFKALIDRINRRQWNMLPDGIHGTVIYNGHSMNLFEFIQHLKQEFPPKSNVTLDIVTIVGGKIPAQQDPEQNDGGGPVGARLRVKVVVVDGTLLSGTQRSTFQYTRHMFAYFSQGKIYEISDISDEGEKFRRVTEITPLPGLRPPPPRVSIDLARFYDDYIKTINSTKGGPPVGGHFCRPSGVVWNGLEKSVETYCRLMGDAFDAIPDLKFNAHTVLVDEESQQIAARIDFTGTPVKPFGGGMPNGRPVAFTEHAFYWLEQGKISDVLTIVDWENYRAQLMY